MSSHKLNSSSSSLISSSKKAFAEKENKNNKTNKENEKHVIHRRVLPAREDRARVLCNMLKPLVAKRAALILEKKTFDSKYQLVDLKGMTSQSSADMAIALNEAEIKAIRSMATSTLGNRSVRINLFSIFYYNTSGAGLIASAVSLDPSSLSEFTTCAALFDEFKVLGGSYQYDNMSYITNNTTSLNSFGIVAYDPTDGSTPASLVSMAQLAHHQLYFKTTLVAATTNPFVRNNSQTFDWKVPPGVITSNAAAATSGTSNWQPTGLANPQPYGWLKAYFDALAASSTGLSGLLTYHTEFRCRE